MTKIIIIGAGFAGLTCALELEKKFKKDKNISITLADKRDYFLFTPNLYEVAASEEEMTSIDQLKRSAVFPISEILIGKNIEFIKAELRSINEQERKVNFGGRSLDYDYLVLAIGALPDFHKITGAETYSLPLGSLPDALRIRNAVEFVVQRHRLDQNKKTLRFVIAGGGPCGVELAGELSGLLDRIAWKNGFPKENLEVVVVESSGSLLPGLPAEAGKLAFCRLKEAGVEAVFGKIIVGASEHFVEFLSGEKMENDLLVWNLGRKAAPVTFQSNALTDKKGRLKVGQYFRVENMDRIFAIGDISAPSEGCGREYDDGNVDQAINQAKYLSGVFPLLLKNQKPRPYVFHSAGRIINISGKWAMRVNKKGARCGFWSYVLGQLYYFRLYWRLAGLRQALRNFWLQRELYGRND